MSHLLVLYGARFQRLTTINANVALGFAVCKIAPKLANESDSHVVRDALHTQKIESEQQ